MSGLGDFPYSYPASSELRVEGSRCTGAGKAIFLSIIVMLTGAIGACSEPEKIEHGLAPAISPSVWVPIEYRWETKQLPLSNYANEASPFFTAFKEEWEGLKKKEYETTKEFDQRIRREKPHFGFSTDVFYAFPLLETKVIYNADTQSFETPSIGSTCWWDTPISGQAACPLGRSTDSTDTYRGRNAYDVTAEVVRTKGREFYLALPRKNLTAKLFRRSLPFAYDLALQCRVPLQEARDIPSENLGVLVVGKLRSHEFLVGNTDHEFPTVSNPVEQHFETQAIPFEISGFVCYDSRTGAVLDTVKI